MGWPRPFFAARAAATEAVEVQPARRALAELNDVVLDALGFAPERTDWELKRNTVRPGHRPGRRPRRDQHRTAAGRHRRRPRRLASTTCSTTTRRCSTRPSSPASCCAPAARATTSRRCTARADAVGEIFSTDEPPRYVLVLGGNVVLLAERAKWAEGRFLAVDLDAALERNDTKAKGELETIAALFSADALVPERSTARPASRCSTSWSTSSHKHAVGVSQGAPQRHPREHRDPRQRGHRAARQPGPGPQPDELYTRSDVDATRAHPPVPALPVPAAGAALRRVPPRARHPAGQRRRLPRRLQPRPPPRAVPGRARQRRRPQRQPPPRVARPCCSSWSTTATTPRHAEQQLALYDHLDADEHRALGRGLPPVPRPRRRAVRPQVDQPARRGDAAQRGPATGAAQADAEPRGKTAKRRRPGSSPTPSSASTSSARSTRA